MVTLGGQIDRALCDGDGPITFLDAEEAAKINDLRQAGYVRQWEQWKRACWQVTAPDA